MPRPNGTQKAQRVKHLGAVVQRTLAGLAMNRKLTVCIFFHATGNRCEFLGPPNWIQTWMVQQHRFFIGTQLPPLLPNFFPTLTRSTAATRLARTGRGSQEVLRQSGCESMLSRKNGKMDRWNLLCVNQNKSAKSPSMLCKSMDR